MKEIFVVLRTKKFYAEKAFKVSMEGLNEAVNFAKTIKDLEILEDPVPVHPEVHLYVGFRDDMYEGTVSLDEFLEQEKGDPV